MWITNTFSVSREHPRTCEFFLFNLKFLNQNQDACTYQNQTASGYPPFKNLFIRNCLKIKNFKLKNYINTKVCRVMNLSTGKVDKLL